MLLTKIQDTQQLMVETQNLQQKVDSIKKYDDFYMRLKNELKTIKEFITCAIALQIINHNEFHQLDLSLIENTLNSLLDTFEKEPSIRKLQEFIRYIKEKDNELKIKWQDFAKYESEESRQILDSIKGFLQDKTEVELIRQSLESLSNTWPVTKKNVEYFLAQYQKALNKITELDVSPSIQKFLEKVSNDHATLNDVTDEVMEWLKEHQFLDKLYITFK